MRTPISCRRSLTLCAMTPYSPIAASSTAAPAKTESTIAATRRRLAASLMTCSTVRSLNTGTERSRSRIAVSIDGAGDRAPRARDRKHRRPRLLHDRQEDLLRRVLIDAVLLDVADNADNGAPRAVALGRTPAGQPDLLPDRIFILSDEAPRPIGFAVTAARSVQYRLTRLVLMMATG